GRPAFTAVPDRSEAIVFRADAATGREGRSANAGDAVQQVPAPRRRVDGAGSDLQSRRAGSHHRRIFGNARQSPSRASSLTRNTGRACIGESRAALVARVIRTVGALFFSTTTQ